jgi:hypothetical protein
VRECGPWSIHVWKKEQIQNKIQDQTLIPRDRRNHTHFNISDWNEIWDI